MNVLYFLNMKLKKISLIDDLIELVAILIDGRTLKSLYNSFCHLGENLLSVIE